MGEGGRESGREGERGGAKEKGIKDGPRVLDDSPASPP